LRKINASVLRDWSPETNRRCKFYPGDLAKINYRESHQSGLANKYAGQWGKIIAVSSGAPGKVRGRYTRQFTRYYVEMIDGEIIGTDSSYLTAVD